MLDQSRVPLYDKIIEHRDLHSTSFHVPGHKAGNGLDGYAANSLAAVMSIDVTELTGLDDLHQPEGVIREAELLAAECFGADHTFLLVGGSTVGNLAFILSMCRKGHNDLFIVQRNAHKSIIHGLMLAGAQAVFLSPQVDMTTGIAAGVSVFDIEAALKQYPDAAGVILTNPNYYGLGVDLKEIIDRVHKLDIPVLVDEAHGAHYGFHQAIPQSALSAGADGVVQSTHKMLTAMTMGAMLHIQGSRIDPQVVRQRLSMVQSSSPSYPILASLDLSRRQLRLHGQSLLEQALASVKIFRTGMLEMPWFQLVGEGIATQATPATPAPQSAQASGPAEAFTTLDPLKITIGDRTGTLSGFDLQRLLEQHRCYPEMADPHYVVLALSLVTKEQDVDRLLQALLSISEEFQLNTQERVDTSEHRLIFKYPPISEPVTFSHSSNPTRTIHTELGQPYSAVSIEEAVGSITQQAITPYPPGIPILYPGERVTAEVAEQLRVWIEAGARIHGLTDEGHIHVMQS